MTTDRRNAVIAGILLLMGFAGVAIPLLTNSILDSGPEFLVTVAGNENCLAWGATFQLVMAFACSGIVVFLYPALRRVSKAWALWSLVLRSFETALFIVAAVLLLSLPSLGKAAIAADTATNDGLQVLGMIMKDAYDWSSAVLSTLAWSLGALIYHVLFFRGRLIPRWLALWGIIGAPPAVTACILTIFGVITVHAAANSLLTIPLGLQEIPLAIWLIAKGTRA